ncbi:hypothetical protein WJX81_000005 [Elliptochloris bilobata]|uniref:Uncharacterized protein n=1 Tax=Elliptochloris bilobata TaxID=381761 RepID=A0AAW1R1K9_9CHLO
MQARPDGCNAAAMLRARETAPHGRRVCGPAGALSAAAEEPSMALRGWAEGDFLRRCDATYCALAPPPRSTIAIAFSPDGALLASTHGDHTVKLVCCRTGACVRVLTGHRRTPWVVRFHPHSSALLASGSLDYEVRLWDVPSGVCLATHSFQKPIASLAFHCDGRHQLLAVASGHKLYLWEYRQFGSSPLPETCLKTRRSLRAVHFHPHGAPLILTAEVHDPTEAALLPAPYSERDAPAPVPAAALRDLNPRIDSPASHTAAPTVTAVLHLSRPHQQGQPTQRPVYYMTRPGAPVRRIGDGLGRPGLGGADAAARDLPSVIDRRWMGPGGRRTAHRQGGGPRGGAAQRRDTLSPAAAAPGAGLPPSMVPYPWEYPAGQLRGQLRRDTALIPLDARGAGAGPPWVASAGGAGVAADAAATHGDAAAVQRAANAAGKDQPCRVKLRVWRFHPPPPAAGDADGAEPVAASASPGTALDEMGVHFSPCGRYLAACVACRAPRLSPEPQAPASASSSVAEEAAAALQGGGPGGVAYEVRIYSVEAASFGRVLRARPIKAAHCLTSLQFSPTSQYLLLAYGRRHISLLRSFMAEDGSATLAAAHTILEIYRVSDMGLVRVLPSAQDEVNAAAFHPFPGGGIVYGTKEGRLRILRHAAGALGAPESEADRDASWRSLVDELDAADRGAELSEDDLLSEALPA